MLPGTPPLPAPVERLMEIRSTRLRNFSIYAYIYLHFLKITVNNYSLSQRLTP